MSVTVNGYGWVAHFLTSFYKRPVNRDHRHRVSHTSYKLEVKLQVAVHIPHHYVNYNNDHFLNANLKKPWALYKEHDGRRGERVNVQVQKSNQIMTEEH